MSQNATSAPVLLLGDSRLRLRSSEVERFDGALQQACATLAATLRDFRSRNGFGRAIAAPQIGIAQRLIAIDLGRDLFFVVNPIVIAKSDSTFTMWDDCMSFPDLLVRLRRHESISIEYVDEEGRSRDWRDLDIAAAELLQHEIDHLDGVLAVDRALDRDALVLKAQFDLNREEYAAQVDYVIGDAARSREN